jgi:hypothetical protein
LWNANVPRLINNMNNNLLSRQVVVLLLATSLLLLPVTQTLACSTVSYSPHQQRSATDHQPFATRKNVNVTTKTTCHTSHVSTSLSISSTDEKADQAGCHCDGSCCQGIINILAGWNIQIKSQYKIPLVPETLRSLKPDHISFPHSPPPIAG